MALKTKNYTIPGGSWEQCRDKVRQLFQQISTLDIPYMETSGGGVIDKDEDPDSDTFGEFILVYNTDQFDESPAGTFHLQHFDMSGATIIADEPIEILSTTAPQLQLSYDGSNNATFAVGSSGDLTIAASGGDISLGDENLITTGNITCGELDVVYGTENRIFDETFEGAGYVESGWTPTTDAGCTVDEDADVTDVGSPSGWGDQCCKFDVVGATGDSAYISNDPAVIPDLADTWVSFEFVLTASTLTNGNVSYLFTTRTSTSAIVWAVYLQGTVVGHKLWFTTKPDGVVSSFYSSGELSLNTVYRVEVKWDSTNNECIWKIDGVVQDTILLSGTHATGIDNIRCGTYFVTATKDITVYMDNIIIDDTGWSDATFNLYNNILSNTAGIINFDNEDLVTTGQVGIGTAAPNATPYLHIQHGSAGADPGWVEWDVFLIETSAVSVIQLFTPNTGSSYVTFSDPQSRASGIVGYLHSTDTMVFWTSGAEQMRIDSTGKVGINDTSPSYELDVTGDIQATGNLICETWRGEVDSDERIVLESDVGTAGSIKFLVNSTELFNIVNAKDGYSITHNPSQLDVDTFIYGDTAFIFKVDAGLDVLRIGDGGTTDYLQIDEAGRLTFAGDARVMKEFELNAISLAPGSTGPDAIIAGNFLGYSYDIGDDSVVSFEIPPDWDISTDLYVKIYWYIDEAYATNNGEVQWRIQWSACPTNASEAIDAPTHTGTLDFGDQNIPATAKHLFTTGAGTISAASLSEGDLIGFTIDRVALDGGNNPIADPVITRIEIEYISDRLGEIL